MTLLTIAAVFAITSLLQQFVMPHLASWPLEAAAAAVGDRRRHRCSATW